MNQKSADKAWQQLQAHVAGFVRQVLRNDMQKTEYKPRFIGQYLEMPFKRHQEEQGKEALHDTKGRLTQAVHAAVHAFK